MATDSAPAGAAAAAVLKRSRQLHGRWRWTPEQKRLRQLVRAQRRVGAELDQLEHGGSRVLHARRHPGSAAAIDHLVVTPGAVFAVVDLVSTSTAPIRWTPHGTLCQVGVGPLDLLEQLHGACGQQIAVATAAALTPGWRVAVVPAVAVTGTWSHPLSHTAGGITVGTAAALRGWVTSPVWPAQLDATDVAVLTNAVARACPSGV